jgi:AraC-like DNA-binding protein
MWELLRSGSSAGTACKRVALRLERGDPVTLAALAVELGYSDQAHLAHDFKNAVGKAPSEFAEGVHR